MKRYKTRTGVVLTSVCGESLLVSAKPLRGVCPFVTTINESSAFLWRRLISGATEDELLAAVEEEYEVEDLAAMEAVIKEFLEQMLEMNYLLMEDREEQNG